MRGGKIVESDPDKSLITKRYTAEAVEVINKFGGGDDPFFLYYAHTMPHVPIFASEQFKDRSLAGLYGDVIEEIDWSVGEVLRAIKEVGADEKTLVIFTSDNGPWLAHKWNGGSAGPFRDGKFSTCEGGVREPFIARWPNRIPAGALSNEVASTMDLFPTCLELAGAKIPSDRKYDGTDISELLMGRKFDREALNFYWRETTLAAVRKGEWKLHVDTYDSLVRQGTALDTPILFNLRLDPGERYDVAEANSEIVKQLVAVLEKHSQTVTRGDEQR